MSQEANKPRTADNEAMAYAKYIRTSPRKLNLVAAMIRGKTAEKALIDLQFCRRRIAQDVKKVLQSAVANAENNQSLDVDRLIVAEASVGKTMTMKRFSARARGRAARIEKPFSNLTIIVREETDEMIKARTAKKLSRGMKRNAAIEKSAAKEKTAADKKSAAAAKKSSPKPAAGTAANAKKEA